jgi:hypothetical protein
MTFEELWFSVFPAEPADLNDAAARRVIKPIAQLAWDAGRKEQRERDAVICDELTGNLIFRAAANGQRGALELAATAIRNADN